MNRTNMEPKTIAMYLVVILVLVMALYYLYTWLYAPSDIQDVVIWSDPSVGLPTLKKNSNTVQTGPSGGTLYTTPVPYIYSGGEYTVSTWIYVTKWDNLGNKPFLTLAGGGNLYNTLVLFLGKNTNKLGVRVSYSVSGSSNACAGLLTIPGSPCITGNVASEYTNMLNYSTNSNLPSNSAETSQGYTDDVMPMADIEEVNLQRWVNITVVLMGRTVDVYVDGKLSRSTVLPGFFKSDGENNTSGATNTQTMRLGEDKSFNGYLGMTRAANVAYTPDRVYANYQQGPFAGWSLSSLDPGQYSLTVKRNSSVVFSTSTS
jgi:hypothetical protein